MWDGLWRERSFMETINLLNNTLEEFSGALAMPFLLLTLLSINGLPRNLVGGKSIMTKLLPMERLLWPLWLGIILALSFKFRLSVLLPHLLLRRRLWLSIRLFRRLWKETGEISHFLRMLSIWQKKLTLRETLEDGLQELMCWISATFWILTVDSWLGMPSQLMLLRMLWQEKPLIPFVLFPFLPLI